MKEEINFIDFRMTFSFYQLITIKEILFFHEMFGFKFDYKYFVIHDRH